MHCIVKHSHTETHRLHISYVTELRYGVVQACRCTVYLQADVLVYPSLSLEQHEEFSFLQVQF